MRSSPLAAPARSGPEPLNATGPVSAVRSDSCICGSSRRGGRGLLTQCVNLEFREAMLVPADGVGQLGACHGSWLSDDQRCSGPRNESRSAPCHGPPWPSASAGPPAAPHADGRGPGPGWPGRGLAGPARHGTATAPARHRVVPVPGLQYRDDPAHPGRGPVRPSGRGRQPSGGVGGRGAAPEENFPKRWDCPDAGAAGHAYAPRGLGERPAALPADAYRHRPAPIRVGCGSGRPARCATGRAGRCAARTRSVSPPRRRLPWPGARFAAGPGCD